VPGQYGELAGDRDEGDLPAAARADALVESTQRSRRARRGVSGFERRGWSSDAGRVGRSERSRPGAFQGLDLGLQSGQEAQGALYLLSLLRRLAALQL